MLQVIQISVNAGFNILLRIRRTRYILVGFPGRNTDLLDESEIFYQDVSRL